MTESKLPGDAALEHIVAEVQEWPTEALGRMIGQLRPSMESGEAGAATVLAVTVLRAVLSQRKVLPMP